MCLIVGTFDGGVEADAIVSSLLFIVILKVRWEAMGIAMKDAKIEVINAFGGDVKEPVIDAGEDVWCLQRGWAGPLMAR